MAHVFNTLINGDSEMTKPILRLTDNEIIEGKNFVEQLRLQKDKEGKSRGIVLMQPFGQQGGFMNIEDVKTDESYRSFDFEFAKKLTDALDKAGYTVMWIKLPNQAGYEKAISFNGDVTARKIMSVIPFVDGVIGCDSFLIHASAGLNNPVPTIALWGGTNPKNLSYKEQINFVNPTEYYEPNRIPHDREFYINKNRDINKFPEKWIPKIVKSMNKPPKPKKVKGKVKHDNTCATGGCQHNKMTVAQSAKEKVVVKKKITKKVKK